MEKDLFVWDTEKELGFYSMGGTVYDDVYFTVRRQEELDSPIRERINTFRTALVNSYTKGLVLDFGCGSGQFIHWRKNCLGYDICPQAETKLRKEALFFNPYERDLDKYDIEGVTFFDSFEHLRQPKEILKRINGQCVFVSIPIFQNKEHALKSKHFKPEHYWFFTHSSFCQFIKDCGFKMLDCRNDETYIGRVDIYTYIFRRGNKQKI